MESLEFSLLLLLVLVVLLLHGMLVSFGVGCDLEELVVESVFIADAVVLL